MESRTASLLEFSKILKALAGYTVSEPGMTACLNLCPFDTLTAIQQEARLVEQTTHFVADSGFALSAFPKLDAFFEHVQETKTPLALDGFFAVSLILSQVEKVRKLLIDTEDASLIELKEHCCSGAWPEKLASALHRCLSPEGRITDTASPELETIRFAIRSIHQQCTKKAKDFILSNDLSRFLQDDYITLSSDRYVLPLKANFKGRLLGIVHDYSQTGETCYFEPMLLVELNNKLQELKKNETREETKILEYLSLLLRSELEQTRAAYDVLIRFDVLLAKAALGATLQGRSLEVQQEGAFALYAVYHPLLLLEQQTASSSMDIKPIDILFCSDTRCLLISGGNAGGKTVALKTVGLAVLMAYSGLPVPIGAGSTLPFFSSLFAIMGDEQSLENHVSTFTAQVQNIARLWPYVDQNTLFLLDEFGAGTDPAQGAALAQAVLEELLKRNAFVLAATHFPALKAWALSKEKVRASSVLFDPQSKQALFELAYDIVGESIALEVAKKHGLPTEILENAEKLLYRDGSDTSGLLAQLNNLALQRQKELNQLKEERAQLIDEQKKYVEQLQKEQGIVLDELRRKSQEILQSWKKKKIGRKESLQQLEELRKKLDIGKISDQSCATKLSFSFDAVEIGEEVIYRRWNKPGLVLEKDQRKQHIRLDLGGVSMWVKATELELSELKPAVCPASEDIHIPSDPSCLSLDIDLRGLRVEEAISTLERFLDKAILRGAERLEIIHGRGTGALRSEVHKVLQYFPGVKHFSVSTEDYGGDGMTEVIFS